jgi:adenosylhomocysteine nucleosidase
MTIGIMGAMPEEIFLISSKIENKEIQSIGNRDYISGELCGKKVVAVFSRWGKVASAQTATTLITKFNVGKIIFTGVAGGADPELEIGDVVISRDLIQHDMDASPIPAFAKFEIPLLGITHFKADPELVRTAEASAKYFLANIADHTIPKEIVDQYSITVPKISLGTIATGDEFIANPAKIAELRSQIPGLQCIEMEGAAVAQVCHEHRIPFVVIRAISDKADSGAIHDFPNFVKHVVSHYSLGIVSEMLSTGKMHN